MHRGLCLMVLAVGVVSSLDLRDCDLPLGMENGDIPDAAITASSSYWSNVGPQNGRLRSDSNGGGWCPKQQIKEGVREYLQIDLGVVHTVGGVQTQGRYGKGIGLEYAEEYTLEYRRPGLPDNEWRTYRTWDLKEILTGNSDTSTIVSHYLNPPIIASQIRILPHSIHQRTVCMRVELRGCQYESGIMGYSMPESKHEGDPGELQDVLFDGLRSGGWMRGGLGLLVDGQIGADNFRVDIGYGKGAGWVGWRNDTPRSRFVELIFEFDQVRNFSAVNLYTNNFFSKDAQVFSRAKIMFSYGGKFYNGRPLTYTYMPDRILEQARNVSIHLHGRTGRFVKLQLWFAAKWILLGEVTFNSDPWYGNVTEETEASVDANEMVGNSMVHDSDWEQYETIAAPHEGQSYVEVVVGVLSAISLLLLLVFAVIVVLSKRHKLQGSPTTILRNSFGATINMKDLLMNLSPMGNSLVPMSGPLTPPSPAATPLRQGSPPPPTLEELLMTPSAPPSCPSPQGNQVPLSSSSNTLYYERQYRSPLIDAARAQNGYAATANLHRGTSLSADLDGSDIEDEHSPLRYNSMEGSLQTGERSSNNQIVNLGNYFPRVASEPTNRKRYHTAPREKHRVPPPVVSWNIAPSMGHPYKCREAEVNDIPRCMIQIVQKMGVCHAGEVLLCEVDSPEEVGSNCPLVAVRVNNDDEGATSETTLREIRFLSSLQDNNVVRMLGVVTSEHPHWTVLEYPELGDLAHFLQFRIGPSQPPTSPCPGNTASLRPNSLQTLSFGCLMFMATQIASGMRYLEQRNVVHKDLAARNCFVGRGYAVRIGDFSMCNPIYKEDYSEIGGRPPRPIRWLPWESILLDRYTCKSSSWSFAVTLWEILTLARDRPFNTMSNEMVIQNAERMYYGGELEVFLCKPPICPKEVYDLMCECWRREEDMRPSFKEIHMFLKRKNMGYQPNK
ncbi:discoidin domain-containing receptor 2-like isoform X2 [Neocloeon triangulifer]|uniref:discoidin domain-containing receptor 2-like isoform X2 n=1 Tax=Neocloeon triangulifer TaxID=2078957 RepID=UPI00286EBB9D|nr:discoidin domain-containing receptor 2-like isoform X2 [Neocloeon triangulifer]